MTVSFRGVTNVECASVERGTDAQGLGWVRAYDADGGEVIALYAMTGTMMDEVVVTGGNMEPAADMLGDLAATAVDHEYRLCLVEVGV